MNRAWWWTGSQVLSASGTVGLLTVSTWLISLHRGPMWVSLASAALFLPSLVLARSVTHLCATRSRRSLLIATQAGAIALSLALAASLYLAPGAAWWLCLLACLAAGLIASIDATARQLIITDLVGSEELPRAVGLYEVALNASRIIGPALTAMVLAAQGASWALTSVAGSYLPAIAFLVRLPRIGPWSVNLHDPGQPQMSPLQVVQHRRDLVLPLLLGTAIGLTFNLSATLPPLLRDTFHASADSYGLLMACFGAGSCAGALRFAIRPPEASRPVLQRWALIGLLAVLADAFAPSVYVLGLTLVVTGWCAVHVVTMANTYVQTSTRPAQRPAVLATWGAFIPGLNPVTALTAGLISTLTGARWGMATSAALLTVALLAPGARPSKP